MTLFLHVLVILSILVVSTTATSSPGYVKQPNNDKNSPSYRYNYEFEDNSGDGHDKTEQRKGEHATGRYYVNSKQASKDVEHVVDEWGYHPLVKYGAVDDHSKSSASFDIGERTVKDLENEDVTVYTTKSHMDDRNLIQLIKPLRRLQQNAQISSRSFSTPASPVDNPSPTSSNTQNYYTFSDFLSKNFLSNSPQKQYLDTLSAIGNSHRLPATYQSDLSSSQDNDISSGVSEGDHLIFENVGNFGQKLPTQNNDGSVYSSTTITTTASPVSTLSETLSAARAGRYFHHSRLHQKKNEPYPPEVIHGLRAYSSTALPLLDNRVTANSIEIDSNAQNHGDNGLVEKAGTKAHQSFDVTSSTIPSLINYASQSSGASNTKNKFLKPIVVPDEAKEERPFQYSTTFECTDDEVATTPYPVKDETISSYILNSIQAGVSLVNAGESHLISNNLSDSSDPAPVNEHIEEPQGDQANIQTGNTVSAEATDYVGVNPAFGGHLDSIQQQPIPQPKPRKQPEKISVADQMVEIQKSIEIYHSTPQHEIHYSEQPAQVAQIDQQQQTLVQQGQQQYFTSNGELNAKQASSDSPTRIYEISNNYPKDNLAIPPVYIVPPATYILDNGSIFNNNLLRKRLQYQAEIAPHNSKLPNAEDNVQIDKNTRTILEKTIHIPHPVEKIVEKKLPYQVEKVLEKKIPIPHPYPMPVEVPIPQPYPVYVEKGIEEKVRIPIHISIPEPYSLKNPVHIPLPIEKIVEKPIHIPVPVEKIVEKKVPIPLPYPVEIEKIVERKIPYPVEITKYVEKPISIQAPYGVQYGVSYQQIMKPQNHGLYSHDTGKLAPLYAVPPSTRHLYSSHQANNITNNKLNYSQPSFQGYTYEKPSQSFHEIKENHLDSQYLSSKIPSSKLSFNSYHSPSYQVSNGLIHRRHAAVHRPSKPDRYYAPSTHHHHHHHHHPHQRQFEFETKASFGNYAQSQRKPRNHESARQQKGGFRQSKVEYGFKPPMVPSVQYDEETASKIES